MGTLQYHAAVAYPYLVAKDDFPVRVHTVALFVEDAVRIAVHHQTIPGKLDVAPKLDMLVTADGRGGRNGEVVAQLQQCARAHDYLRSSPDVRLTLKHQLSLNLQQGGVTPVRLVTFVESYPHQERPYVAFEDYPPP